MIIRNRRYLGLRIKRWGLALISGFIAICLSLVLAPSAQAYWDYDYFNGQSGFGQFWSGASGYEQGGSVYVNLNEGFNWSSTEYTETFDGNTGYLIGSNTGNTHQTQTQWFTETYAYQECGWDSYPYLSGTVPTDCHEWADW